MKHILYCLCIVFCSSISYAQIEYPNTPKKPVVNTYHNVDVTDDYQWLENQENDSVYEWIKDQNKVTLKYQKRKLGASRSTMDMRKYIFSESGEYQGEENAAFDLEKLYFTTFVHSSTGSPSLYFAKGQSSDYQELVNSSYISSKDRINFTGLSLSKDNNHLAYQYNRNGSDWREISVVKIFNRRHYKEVLTHTMSSKMLWLNNGFFYEKFPYDSIRGTRKKPEIRYHVVGTEQSEDKLIFKPRNEDEFLNLMGSKKEDLFIIKIENKKKNIYSYFFIDPLTGNKNFQPFLLNTKYNLNIFKIRDNKLYAFATIQDKRQLISIPIDTPTQFKLLSPTYENAMLDEVEFLDDFMIMSYQGGKNFIITKVDYEGNLIKDMTTPKGLSVLNLHYNKDYKEFFVSMGSYTIPKVSYTLDVETLKLELVGATGVNFDFENYKFTQKTFTSHDGVEVPIFIVYKNELKTDGSTPFLLKTYGGYNVRSTPRYNPGIVYFIENGGAFAYVDIRGGGQLGRDWWREGKRLKKTNGINDFISAAEYLIQEKFTTPKKIAITGTSHGGMITAAALVKRPDLFGSAVIDVGVLDMLRFENFTIGNTSTSVNEFGTVKNEDDFKNLWSYSPYHNVDDTVNYPSMLITTGDHDNRVPPLHSFKFAARLQNNPSQVNPILLWTQSNAGHSGASSRSGFLEELTYIYGFLFHELE